ncbi:MAG: MFS transporter [Hamadaea sp.]|uniref:MFS transporter n=1 Tax=Hamadaea sp. TaxID=2024425 RepID=UPI0018326558|nr:MFS transporter [Hamadaea sp.]NUR70730.1 MFS transporter [Hamadaea sp.]NUT21404.1 MFS transporter [Hamadaea sp.]
MRPVLARHSGFRLLWTSATVSSLGSWLLTIAVPVQVYRLTGQATATGLALALEAAPAILLAPWAGVLADRFDRRRLLVVAHLAAAVAVLVMLLPGTTSIYIGLVLETSVVAFLQPAIRALTPQVVPADADLIAATGTTSITQSVLRLTAPVLGTALLTQGAFAHVVLLDAASYLVAAGLLARLPIRSAVGPASASGTLRAGLAFLIGTPFLRALAVTTWAYWTANAALTALLIPFLAVRLGQPPQTLGLLITGLGVGYLLGSAVAGRLLPRYSTRTLLGATYFAVGLCFLVLFTAPNLPIALAGITAAGVPGAIAVAATQYRLQSATPDGVRGRVLAAFYATDSLATLAGALLGPALSGWIGLFGALLLASATVLVAAIVARLTLPAAIATDPRSTPEAGLRPVAAEKPRTTW